MSYIRGRNLLALLRVVAALSWTTALFRFGGASAVARATRRAMRAQPASEAAITARRTDIRRSVSVFARVKRVWPGEVACLQSALALQKVLAWQGIPSVVRVGVQMEPSALMAHAWLEVGFYRLGTVPGYEDFVRPDASGRQPAELSA